MAKRKKKSAAAKRRRKASLARAEKKRRRKAAAISPDTASAGVLSGDGREPSACELCEGAADVSGERKPHAPRRANPLGSIKHGYGQDFVSRRESAGIGGVGQDGGEALPPCMSELPDGQEYGVFGAYSDAGLDDEEALEYADYYDKRSSGTDGLGDTVADIFSPCGLELAREAIGVINGDVGSDLEAAVARQIELDRRITEGNEALRFSRFSDRRDRYANIESLPDFTAAIKKSDIKDEAKRVIKNDLGATLLRFEYSTAALKREMASSTRSFLKRAYGTEERDAARVGCRIKRVKRRASGALKRVKRDNARYYGALFDAYDRLAAPATHDTTRMNALVTELYELIARRDAVNLRLAALYSGNGGKRGVGVGKRDAVSLKAERRECKRYERLYQRIIEAKIELRSRDRLLRQMDEQVKRAGDIAECRYALGRGHLGRADRKAVRRFLRSKVAEYKKMRVEIDHRARVLIRRANNRRSANRAAVIGWVAFALLLLLVGVAAWNWDAIAELVTECTTRAAERFF